MKPQFILPNFVRLRFIFNELNDIRRELPESFESCSVAGVHGSLNELYWHEKSRLSGNTSYTQHGNRFQKEIDFFSKRKYRIFFDFSNPLLNETDCLDRYGNKALINFESEDNTIILSTTALFNYVKENYPQYNICWKFFNKVTPENVIQQLSQAELVLIPTAMAFDEEFINEIPVDLRERCIFSTNDMCSMECPKFSEHLIKSSKIACTMTNENCNDFCPIFYGRMNREGKTTYSNKLTKEKIINELMPLGYKTFYIDSCQLSPYHFIKETVQMLVKEEYQLDVLNVLYYMTHIDDLLQYHRGRNS